MDSGLKGKYAFICAGAYGIGEAGRRSSDLEWAKDKVNVNVVAPCITETETRRIILEKPGYKEMGCHHTDSRRTVESTGRSGGRCTIPFQPSVGHGCRPRSDGGWRLDDSLKTKRRQDRYERFTYLDCAHWNSVTRVGICPDRSRRNAAGAAGSALGEHGRQPV